MKKETSNDKNKQGLSARGLLILLISWLCFSVSCTKPNTDATENPSGEPPVMQAAPTDLPVSGLVENEPLAETVPEPQSTLSPTPQEHYEINYVIHNTTGRYADLSLGPLIAAFNAADYDADPTGVRDNTGLFQRLIDQIGAIGGGILYIPEGFYRVEGTLRVVKGVTLRGDWVKPEPSAAVEGTVLMAYTGRGLGPTDAPFIEMEVGAGVMDLAIFYPEQQPENIVPYSPAIRLGVEHYFGNEYNNVKNVTLVNAYIGVLFSYTNGGASPVVNGLYGSPLAVGVEVDNIADVGRIEWLDLSPEYWIHSGLYKKIGLADPFQQENAAQAVRDFIYNNGAGLIMRRNDWSYAAYITVEGYRDGYLGAKSIASPGSTPNGHNYNFYFINCQNGVHIEATNDVGVLFNKIITEGCQTGIKMAPSTAGAVQFANCILDAEVAVDIDEASSTKFLFNESTVAAGQVMIKGGTFQAVDTDFLNKSGAGAHIEVGSFGRVNIVGCRFNGEADIQNRSVYICNIEDPSEDTSSDRAALSQEAPIFNDIGPVVKTPAQPALYVVTDTAYGAAVNDLTVDSTASIQQALEEAAADGGGYVYLPSGKYRLDGFLVVPSGVELVGGMANSSVPHGEGAILECFYGKNDPAALPFIQLEKDAGLRGVTIDYPLQDYAEYEGLQSNDNGNPSGDTPADAYAPDYYPYAIQGQGSGVYVINVGVRACYAALDLFTYSCDNFYVDFLTGHMFKQGVRVGGGSKNGILSNLMCNIIVYACGQESKFGSFPNSPAPGVSNKPLYDYGMLNLDFLILGDCEGLTLYNCFNYGSYRGILFQNEGSGGPQNGISMGSGLDGDTYGLYIGEGVNTRRFDFINTQVVTVTDGFSPPDASYIYSEGNNDFDITFYTSDYWGSPFYAVFMGENSGALRFETAHFRSSGQLFAWLDGGSVSLRNSSLESLYGLWGGADGARARIAVTASILRNSGIDLAVAAFENNIPILKEFVPDK